MTLSGWLLLLVLVAAAGAYAAWTRRAKRPPTAVSRVSGNPDDLGTLGLSEVRAASPRREGDAPQARPVARPAEPARSDAPTPRAPRPPALADGSPWTGDAVGHLLASLAAHAGGSVAIVRHDGERFRVEARSDGGPLTSVRGRPLTLDGPADLGAGALGGLSALVGGRARAVPVRDCVVLVGGEAAAADRYLALLDALAPTEAEPIDAESTDADTDGAEASGPVPRATIIAQEQAEAADAGRPLAFALVTLADAEELLMTGTPESVAVAEAALRDRLELADATRRVEPFGDLLFGAFLDLDPAGTADWCGTLAASDPPLFIGAVAPADGEPSAVRDAAAEALRDAYDQQRTRVVEV